MKKILVCGDVMLDRYLIGDVTRLSQEAPVPVVNYQREEFRPGAAANVAMNCKAMGADTTLVSVMGNDKAGDILSDVFGYWALPRHGGNTTEKLRIIGKQQQIVRIDYDHSTPDLYSKRLCDILKRKLLDDIDIVVLSDYGKGALKYVDKMIAWASLKGKIILVDPKGHNYKKYSGATIIKPNIDEMREMVGGWDSEDELSEKARQFMKDGNFGAVLLTRASEGMTLFTKDETHSIKAEAKEVFDVTGAGDTAIAAFAVALARGHDYLTATQYANKASGIVVGKFGTSVATEEEVFG